MKKLIAAVAAISVSFSASALVTTQERHEIWNQYKTRHLNMLVDPDSAKFRCVRIVVLPEYVSISGEYNSRNRAGGYVGYSYFEWRGAMDEIRKGGTYSQFPITIDNCPKEEQFR